MASELKNKSSLDKEDEDEDDENSSQDDDDEEEEDEPHPLIHPNLSACPPKIFDADLGSVPGGGPSGSLQIPVPRASSIATIKDPKCKRAARAVYMVMMGPLKQMTQLMLGYRRQAGH